MKEFEGKTAVITGGASGIGYAIAERCANEKMNIVLADIETQALDKTKNLLETNGTPVLAVKTEVSNPEDIERLANKTIDAFGEVHLLFNNAGVFTPNTLWKYSIADWEWVLGVNLWGVIHGVRIFTPLMINQNTDCHIINTASMGGFTYDTYMSPYNVSKFGVVALSESLYLELVDQGSKIKVSVLCPGIVKTRLLESGRNRLSVSFELKDVSEKALELKDFFSEAMSSQESLPSVEVVNKVFQAIKEERFYVFTHDYSFEPIRERMNNILNQRNPTLTR